MVEETNRNTITNKIVKESEKNQGVITKRDILDYKGYTILQSFYGKKMKNTLIEIKDDITIYIVFDFCPCPYIHFLLLKILDL